MKQEIKGIYGPNDTLPGPKLITYYYIANFKPRGRKEHYVGDGIRQQSFEGETKAAIKKELARNYRTSAARIKLTFHSETV